MESYGGGYGGSAGGYIQSSQGFPSPGLGTSPSARTVRTILEYCKWLFMYSEREQTPGHQATDSCPAPDSPGHRGEHLLNWWQRYRNGQHHYHVYIYKLYFHIIIVIMYSRCVWLGRWWRWKRLQLLLSTCWMIALDHGSRSNAGLMILVLH